MPDQPSFSETADIETSSDGYASRFSGTTGKWFLQVQERIVLSMLADRPNGEGRSVLDVGGGHGQLALPLCREGYRVTVVGSDQSCRKQIAGLADAGQCSFRVGNLIALPFEDRSFDVALCFRLLPHCAQWQKLIGELCRVAKQSVVADYPSIRSCNAIVPLLFGAKKAIEKNTREWTSFRHADIRNEFARHGFLLEKRRAQFFLPMAFHRMLKARGLSAVMEAVFRATGLTAFFGSPVIVEMRPR
jgi:ubiquinone/menaquinone biosynthesis C-methylase UbiE